MEGRSVGQFDSSGVRDAGGEEEKGVAEVEYGLFVVLAVVVVLDSP